MKTIQAGILLFLLSQPVVRGQQLIRDNGPDSLKNAIERADSDTSKAYLLQQLSDYWLYRDSVKAMQRSLEIFSIAKKNKSDYLRGIGHYQTGGIYLEYYNLDSAETHLLQAIDLLDSITLPKAREYLARSWHSYASLYQRQGNEEKFVDILLNTAIPILEELKDTLRIGKDYHDAGLAFKNTKQWKKAEDLFDRAIRMLEHYPEQESLVIAHLSASANLMYMEDDAPEQLRKIKQHLHRARELLSVNPASPVWVNYYTCNGMFYQYYREEPEIALENYDKGLLLARKLDEDYLESDLVNRKFYLYYDQGQYALARKMAYKQYEMAKRYSFGKNLRIALRHLVDVEEKSGNIRKAYEYLNRHIAVSDSLKENETKVRILELEKKYRVEKKDNEILRLTNESSIKELKLQRSRSWGYLAGGAALILGLGCIAGFKLYRSKRQILRQKEQLHRQEVENLQKEQRQSNLSAMVKGQEQERKRVATDLHDGLGGALSGIKLKLSQAVSENNLNGQFSDILSQMDDAVAELRRIARNLMPETLLRFGLLAAVQEFCQSMESGPIKITFQAYGVEDEHMPQATRFMLYRIVQELVTNAVKHAKPSAILVQLIQNDSGISLTVEDDGMGFDLKSVNIKHGIGLSTVKSRVDYLNGRLDLLSEPGTGTTVSVDIA